MTMLDRIILKGRHIVICDTLQRQALEKLHVKHMGIAKAKLLACESIYWICMINDIKNYMKSYSTSLDF